MRRLDNLIAGHLDINIAMLIKSDWLAQFSMILIASLDSETDLTATKTGQEIIGSFAQCEFLGTGLGIPGVLIGDIAKKFDIFNGFDEAWCFERIPVFAKPADLSIVSPFDIGADALPPYLTEWMRTTECKLGLGDGIGLNYVTPSEAVAKALEVRSRLN